MKNTNHQGLVDKSRGQKQGCTRKRVLYLSLASTQQKVYNNYNTAPAHLKICQGHAPTCPGTGHRAPDGTGP